MMAEKARVFGDDEMLRKILASDSPRQQKALGRKIRNFDDDAWNGVCRGVVYTGNLARFQQDAVLARTLLVTGEKIIVEASPYDTIWGIGLSQDDPRALNPAEWRGTNWLGIALMQVREALRRGEHGQPADPSDPELIEQLERRSAIIGL